MHKQKYCAIFILVFITIGITAYCQYPCLKEKLVYHCDVNQFFFPIYHLLNPEILKNDFFVDYMLFQMPKGYISFFFILGRLFDLVFLAKILPFLFALISVIYLFLLGRTIKGEVEGFIMSFLFIFYSWTFHTFHGSTPRSFAYPLFIPLLYYLAKHNYKASFFLYVLQIFFYPPIALVSAATVFFMNIAKFKIKIDRHLIFMVLGFFMPFPLLFFLQYDIKNRVYGPVVTFKDMRNMPEFGPGGSDSFFLNNIMQFLRSPRAGINLTESFAFLLLFLIGLVIILRIRRRKVVIPEIISALFWSSLSLYLLSYLVLLHLYYPARYIILSGPVICCVLIGIMMGGLIGAINCEAIKRLAFGIFIFLIILFYAPRINGRLLDHSDLTGLVNYLSNVSPDSIIVSTPDVSDPIPTFSKRKVLFSSAMSVMVFQKAYYENVKRRIYDFYKVYYSGSLDDIRNFCAKYSVDYIVINRWHFTKEYFKELKIRNDIKEPYRSYVVALERKGGDYILPKIADAYKVFEDREMVVMRRVE